MDCFPSGAKVLLLVLSRACENEIKGALKRNRQLDGLFRFSFPASLAPTTSSSLKNRFWVFGVTHMTHLRLVRQVAAADVKSKGRAGRLGSGLLGPG